MGALAQLREGNRQRIVGELRRRGTATRGEPAEATGLSRTTVATLAGAAVGIDFGHSHIRVAVADLSSAAGAAAAPRRSWPRASASR